MNVGWGWGFGVPMVTMIIAIIFFFIGSRWYELQIFGGNPLIRICQVIVATSRKVRVQVPDDKSLLYETIDAESAIKGSRKLEHTNELK